MRLVLGLLVTLSACTAYEYEEEFFLEVDGSGRFRVSGSSEAIGAVLPLTRVSVETVRDHFDEPQVELDSVRETEHDGRSFIHVQARFSDWNRLCAHPAFSERHCRLVTGPDVLEIESTIPEPLASGRVPTDPNAPIVFRFHFPSTVAFHNSPNEIERGNSVRWQRSIGEHFAREPLVIQARFEKRSLLETSAVILIAAVSLVAIAISGAIVLIVRKGKQQLESDASRKGTQARRGIGPSASKNVTSGH